VEKGWREMYSKGIAEPAVVRKSWFKAKREGKSVKGRKRGKKEGVGLWVWEGGL
jgi:hypothetical protein